MSVLAALRPDSWDFPLLLHVLGAAILVGALLTAGAAQLVGWRESAPAAALTWARITFFALLAIAIPAWILMRVAGQWIASEEGFEGENVPTWVEIGYVTADPGGGLILIATVLAGFGLRRLRARGRATSGLSRAAGAVTLILLLAYLVTVWAMTTKPS
ncbi:MAG TPA: hypothetical protein VHF67_00650 [Gaiellaceae bacterium]|nr:hypothetical protein [Gaiellaceae bacterium]